MNRYECLDDFQGQFSSSDPIDLVKTENGADLIYPECPELDTSLGDGMHIVIDSKSCFMDPVANNQKQTENNAHQMLARPVQQKTNLQLQEEINHLKEANIQLQETMNRLKDIRINPQRLVKVLQNMMRKQRKALTVDEEKHEIDTPAGVATANSSVLSSNGLVDSVHVEIGPTFDTFHPELDTFIGDGTANIIDSGIEGSTCNLSVGTKSCFMDPVGKTQKQTEESAQEQRQSRKCLQLQGIISQLREEISHLKKSNSQLQDELNALQMSPQESLEIQEMRQPQVEQASTVNQRMLEMDDTTTVTMSNNSVSTNYSISVILKRLPIESMQQYEDLDNDGTIVLQSGPIRMIDPGAHEQHRLVKRPSTQTLRSITKQSRRCSQSNVNQKTEVNENGMNNCLDEEENDRTVDGDEDEHDYFVTDCSLKKLKKEQSRYDENKVVCDVKLKSRLEYRRMFAARKLHLCEVCEKSFQSNADLRRHLMIHTGERPYVCELCTKSFRRKGHLSDHLRIHSDEKPYNCEACDKSFRQKTHFNTHTKRCVK